MLYSLFVIWGAVTIVFFVVRVVSGNPALVLLGPNATQQEIAAAEESLGLTDPLPVQYARYVGDVARLDFGQSFVFGGPAVRYVVQRAPASANLAIAAMVVVVLASFPLGIAAARKPGGVRDKLISTASLAGQALPNFWIGIMLVLIFARALRVLPSAGAETWSSLVLPSITLALPFVGLLSRLVRGGLIEVLREGYIQTARAKGLSERVVLYVHALRNMLIPVVTVLGLLTGTLFGGAVIIETVFAWPGIGQLLVDSIQDRDYPIVQASIALIVALYVMVNLIVDILYGYLDPRVRVGEGRG